MTIDRFRDLLRPMLAVECEQGIDVLLLRAKRRQSGVEHVPRRPPNASTMRFPAGPALCEVFQCLPMQGERE